jgi:hypothetical protein
MNFIRSFNLRATLALALICAAAPALRAQDSNTTTATVVSSSRNTVTVRNANGQYELYVFDSSASRPATLQNGSQVRITSTAGDEPGVRVISSITTVQAGQTAAAPEPVISPEVRRIERDIERQARRFQTGVRAGFALDPELITVGVQSQIGPFFNRDVFFRPSVEFGWGEVTSLFALNPDIIYRLPLSSRTARWSTYVGGGPGFNFLHQNFERTDGSGKRIDFGDFHSDVALNILGGVRYRSGMFTEIRTSVYSDPSPTLRVVIGYNF